MNGLKLTLIVLTVAWLQMATLAAIRPLDVVPNLALVVLVVLAVRLSLPAGLVAAAILGVLLDFGSGSDFGLRVSFYLLLVLSIGLLRQVGSDLDNLSLMASVVVAATVALNLAILANLTLVHASLPMRLVFAQILLEIGCNLILLIPIRWGIAKIMGRSTEIAVSIGGRRG